MEVDEAEFFNRLLDYRNILFLCHRNADPDAISSAFALSEAIGGTVGLVDGRNRVASVLVERLGIEVVDKPNPADYGFVVAVDTSTKAQLNDLELTRYSVIDHHTTTALTENAEFYLHRNTTSTGRNSLQYIKSNWGADQPACRDWNAHRNRNRYRAFQTCNSRYISDQ